MSLLDYSTFLKKRLIRTSEITLFYELPIKQAFLEFFSSILSVFHVITRMVSPDYFIKKQAYLISRLVGLQKGFFKIMMITLISSKNLGGIKLWNTMYLISRLHWWDYRNLVTIESWVLISNVITYYLVCTLVVW